MNIVLMMISVVATVTRETLKTKVPPRALVMAPLNWVRNVNIYLKLTS